MRLTPWSFVLSPANGDMSQATVTAQAVPNAAGDARHQRFSAICAQWTGSPVGSIQLYGSPDQVSWYPIGSAVAVSGAGGNAWDLIDTGFFWLQVVYTKTSGTGTLTVNASNKGE